MRWVSPQAGRVHRGVTLVELLCALAVIGVLVSILLPAVQLAREAARKTCCADHLRQIALAVHQYQTARGKYPPSFVVPPGTTVRGSWSIHARLLPYIEQDSAATRIRLDQDWHAQVDTGIPGLGISLYVCPSELHPEPRMRNGKPYVHPVTYGFNLGTWLIHDPRNGATGDGAFRVNRSTAPRDIRDGLSNTLCVAEVKAYTPYVRNSTDPGPTIPRTADYLPSLGGELKLGPAVHQNTGHTVWPDGRVHHTGFTTVFGPNALVKYWHAGAAYDIDYTSWQEGRRLDRVTYAAITARSYHVGGVQAAMMDGSVRTVYDGIELSVWRALGTRDGHDR